MYNRHEKGGISSSTLGGPTPSGPTLRGSTLQGPTPTFSGPPVETSQLAQADWPDVALALTSSTGGGGPLLGLREVWASLEKHRGKIRKQSLPATWHLGPSCLRVQAPRAPPSFPAYRPLARAACSSPHPCCKVHDCVLTPIVFRKLQNKVRQGARSCV